MRIAHSSGVGMTVSSDALRLATLLQLSSSLLPTGNFSYSQGFEQAVHQGWVRDEAQAFDWIRSHWSHWFAPVELGVLARCMQLPCGHWRQWDQWFCASRDARQAREETFQLGSALRRWLQGLHLAEQDLTAVDVRQSFDWLCNYPERPSAPVAFAACARVLGLDCREACLAWGWSWLENQVQCAVRIIPLGQTSGQRLLRRLIGHTVASADDAATHSPSPPPCAADATCASTPGGFAPLAAIAGMRHERQYSRLYRS